MSKAFKVPRNREEIMAWIDSIPLYKGDQPLDLAFKSKEEIRSAQDANLVAQMERWRIRAPSTGRSSRSGASIPSRSGASTTWKRSPSQARPTT